MFEQLVLVDHPNIVKLHKYWLDVKDSKARVGRTQGHTKCLGVPRLGEGCHWEPGGDPSSAPHPAPQDLHPFPRTLLPAAPCAGPAQAACCWLVQPMAGWGADASLPSQVIFITEYVSSGSLKQFLKKTKKNHKAMNARVGFLGACTGCPR